MRLIYSAIQTPDGTILESRHTHDYRTHVDTVTGEEYMIDGGLSYQRTNVNKVPAKDLSIYMEDGHEKVREVIAWGTYGKEGKGPFRLVLLKDMETDHIQACLDNVPTMHPYYKESFTNELEYRKQPLFTGSKVTHRVLSFD